MNSNVGQLIEYIVIIMMVAGFITGLINGFIKIFFSWFSVLLGIIVAINFAGRTTQFFFSENSQNVLVIFLVGTILFVLVYAVMSRLGVTFSLTLQKMNMGSLDFLLGGIFGAAQAMLLAGLLVYGVIQMEWVDMSAYPFSMFSSYWSDRILFIFKEHIPTAKQMFF